MPSYDPKLFNITPYFDDYDEAKKFIKVLFRPGYAVQARELTQLQTILQNQIERFGNHIFQDGSKVYGGEIITSTVRYQRIEISSDPSTGSSINVPLDQLIGYEITSSSGVKAKVIHAIESNGGKDNYKIIFFSYISGSSFSEGETFTTSYPGAGWKGVFASASIDENDATLFLGSNGLSGDSNIVSINDGIFYIDGYFVQNDLQKFTPYTPTGDSSSVRDFNNPTTSVGFALGKNSISDNQDLTLRDPASGSYNYNAPGADRYALDLSLSQNTTYSKDFLELVKYESGVPTKRLLKTQYAEIEKTLARRTHDESGSYTVKPFEIDVREHLDNGTNRGIYSGASGDSTKLVAGLETGKAYVFGHEYETQKTHFLDVDKARTTATSLSRQIDTNLGSYIEGAYACQEYFSFNVTGADGVGLPEWSESIGFGKYLDTVIDEGLEINLHAQLPYYHADLEDTRPWPLFLDNFGHYDASSLLGTDEEEKITNTDLAEIIGTARIKMVITDGSDTVTDISGPIDGDTTVPTYRVYLYDVAMNSGKSMSEVCMITYTDLNNRTRTGYNVARAGADTTSNNYIAPTFENLGFTPVGDNRYKILFVGGKIGGWKNDTVNDEDCQLATEPIDVGGLKGNNNYVISIPEGPAVKSVNTLEFRKIHIETLPAVTSDDDVITVSTTDPNITFVGEGTPDGSGNEILGGPVKNENYLIVSTDGGFSVPLDDPDIIMSLSSDKMTLTIRGIKVGPAEYSNDYNHWLTNDNIYTLYATQQLRDTDDTSPTTFRRNKTLVNKLYTGINADNDRVLTDDVGQNYFLLPDVDIWRINGITGGTGAGDFDVKSDFIFDNGQRDSKYDYGRLYIKPDKIEKYNGRLGEDPHSVTLNISYDYLEHSGSDLPFTVNSYINDGTFKYKDIPLYTIEETGQVVSLANILDFRSTRASREGDNGSESDQPLISGGFPKTGVAGGDVIYESHEYYLPRVDKILLKKDISTNNHSFEVLKGIPSLNPQAPSDREDAMSLYILSIPPYTYNTSDVRIQYIDNQRYTMSDIGKLNQRVSDLEHYSTLSSLESQIEGKNIFSHDGTSVAFKKGILVDSFRGSGVGDISDPDYACSVDFEKGQLRPAFLVQNVDLTNSSSSDISESTDGIITLNQGTPSTFIGQTISSRTIKINPFNLVNWLGSATIDPPGDNWFDVNYRPIVKINVRGENDNWKVGNFDDHSVGNETDGDLVSLNSRGFGSQWNDWESMWTGIEYVQTNLFDNEGKTFIDQARVTEKDESVTPLKENNTNTVSRNALLTSQTKTRLGVRVRTLPHRLQKLVNGRIVDVTVVPFIRSKILTVNAYGLKPDTVVYPFFDGVDVSSYCQTSDGLTGGSIASNSNGSIENLIFRIPEGKFTTGEKVFRLTDNSKNNVSSTKTAVDVTYHAKGISDIRNSGIVSTRPPIVRRQTVTSENISTDVFNRRNSLDSQTNTLWVDPLAQTFYVEPNAYPSGLFLYSVDLYFAAKDTTLPVTLQIRPTINGYPHSSVIAPFSEVVKMPVDVNVDDETASTATTFTFSSPVYLEPGEYSIVLITNSDNYELYAATIGDTQTGSSNRITSSPYTGSLFYAQNESIAEPDYTTDLMFDVKRCVFESSTGTVTFKNSLSGPVSNRKIDCDTFKVNAADFIPAGTSMTHKAQFTADGSFDVSLNENITKGANVSNKKIIKNDDNFRVTSTINYSTTNASISPVIDTKMLNVTCIENSINNKTTDRVNDEKNPVVQGHPYSGRARYITRRVTLPSEMSASDLRVFVSLYKPSGANIRVFMKYSDGNTDINNASYIKLDGDAGFTSSSEFDFRDVEYKLSQADYDNIGIGNIKTFVIKIVMFGNDDEVPIIKDLRAVALD